MANRRMFSLDVVESDAFLNMPATTQNLYFHMGMHADDEGFLGSPQRVIRTVGATNDDFHLLCVKGFVIPFQSGVIVISHWNLNNQLRKDRVKSTVYLEEKSQIQRLENGIYCPLTGYDNQLTTNCQPNDNQLPTKCPPSIVEYSIVENRIENTYAHSDEVRKGDASLKPKKEEPPLFASFWEVYPKKKDKPKAMNAWKRLKVDESLLQTILSAVERDKQSNSWQKENGQYIPYPASWLNGRRWEDEEAVTEDDLPPEWREN